jgi:hypothetical protein
MHQKLKSFTAGFAEYFCSSECFGSRNKNIVSLLILVTWLAVVIFVSTHHEVRRDEVRALSAAIEPASIWQLPSSIKYEGHPILWYLILRIAFCIMHTPVALKAASICIAFASVIIFCRYAPFPVWQKILFICGLLPAYEYCVTARNYGISMLLFFLFAMLYPQRKKRPVVMACILAALANTNMHSCILTGVLTAMWLFDTLVVDRRALNARSAVSLILVLAIIATGIFCSVITVLPSRDTVIAKPFSTIAPKAARALYTNILHPGTHLDKVLPHLPGFARDILVLVLVAGLLTRPQAAISLFAGVVFMGTFFSSFYQDALRHQGITVIFAICLYWIVNQQITNHTKNRLKQALNFMHKLSVYIILSAIFVVHIFGAAYIISTDISKERSSSKAFGRFIAAHPEYHDAIIMGEPDYLLESLPYYASNRIYIPREQRFGNITSFTSASKAQMSLGELLSIARQVKNSKGVNVLIVMGHLDLFNRQEYKISYPFSKTFTWSPEELAAFKSQTTKVAEFNKAVAGDENYEIYLLN